MEPGELISDHKYSYFFVFRLFQLTREISVPFELSSTRTKAQRSSQVKRSLIMKCSLVLVMGTCNVICECNGSVGRSFTCSRR